MVKENLPQSAEGKNESKEGQRLSFDTFGKNIDLFKKNVGYRSPVKEKIQKEDEKVNVLNLIDSLDDQEQTQYMKKEYVPFEDLVQRNLKAQSLQSNAIANKGDTKGEVDMTTLQEISLRMTLWKYENIHLQEYADSMELYRKHLDNYPNRKAELQNLPDIQKLESQTNSQVERLNGIIPLLEVSSRLVWCLDLLADDKSGKSPRSPKDRAILKDLEKSLRARLPAAPQGGSVIQQNSGVEDLRKAQDDYAGIMRSILQKTANVSGESVSLPHALYLAALMHQRELSYKEVQDKKPPSAAAYKEFMDIQQKLNREALSHHVDTLKNNADRVSLLAMRERFAPDPDIFLKATTKEKKNFADFYQKYLLPDDLKTALKSGDLTINLDGMTAYADIVGKDALNYGTKIELLQSVLASNANKQLEDLGMWAKHGLAEIAFWVPEHTLGYLKPIGIDYAKLIGQDDELKNHREYREFKKSKQEAEGISEMIKERKPKIDGIRNDLDADKKAILELQKVHPPEECVPGRDHNGVSYDEIRKQYFDAIQLMKIHHKALHAEVDGLYADMHKILSYHVGRQKELELLSNELAPDFRWGLGLTIGVSVPIYEALAYTARHYGLKIAGSVVRNTARGGFNAAEFAAARPAATLSAAFVIGMALRLKYVMERDSRLEALPEMENIKAAAELMELKGNKKADQYPIEMGILRDRLASIELRMNIQDCKRRLGIMDRNPNLSAQYQPTVKNLIERTTTMEKSAQQLTKHLEKSFPITDYLVTDPKLAQGNVGVNIRNIDDARPRGMKYRSDEAMSKIPLSKAFEKRPREKNLLDPSPLPKQGEKNVPNPELEALLKEVVASGNVEKGSTVDPGLKSLTEEYDKLLPEVENLEKNVK